MRVRAGTSGYAYNEWKGSFYPSGIKADGMLRYYAERFSAVEINNTFYRTPSESTLLGWAESVPDGFTFVLKASQRITHIRRLREVSSEVGFFLQTASVLGDKLGPTLFQLPPNMKKDVARLTEFLELIPRVWRAAMEFRHASWFDEEVFDLLRSRDIALCLADTDEETTPFEATASWGYLRLRRVVYEELDLAAWAERVLAQSWGEAFVFFKHEDEATGPALAARFMRLVNPTPDGLA
ncbi:MAG: DUF72 domain-containing protein [Anaerolineae bacterium]|nr:DUF72 domain-containing protein [Gemmatimonadaceae bacterium]